jgi:hypothetical protein
MFELYGTGTDLYIKIAVRKLLFSNRNFNPLSISAALRVQLNAFCGLSLSCNARVYVGDICELRE